jgi:hypothetical protein
MIETLARLIARRREPSRAADPRLTAFARGLALGALAGAAIAGSTLWNGRHRDR